MSLKSAGVSHTGLIGTKLPLGIWCTVETYGLRDLMFEELSREIWFVKRTRGNVCWTIRWPKPPHPDNEGRPNKFTLMEQKDIHMRRAWVKPHINAEYCENTVQEVIQYVGKLPRLNTPVNSGCGDGVFIEPADKIVPIASTIGELILQPDVWYEHFWVIRAGRYNKEFKEWGRQYVKPTTAVKVPQNYPPATSYLTGVVYQDDPMCYHTKQVYMSSRMDGTFDRFLPVNQIMATKLEKGLLTE